LCSIVGEARGGKEIFFPDYFVVQPQSAAAVGVNTPARYPWRLERLVLHMQNSALMCTAETAVPVPLAVRALQISVYALIAVLVTALALSWFMRPRIQAFAAPQTLTAGSTASVSYETEGWGTTWFYVGNDEGPVRRGKVEMGQHDVTFRTAKRPQLYRVLLTVDGFVGGTSVEQDIRTVSPQRAPRALPRTSIDVLEVNPPIATAGTPLSVRYVLGGAAPKSAKVSILDAIGFPLVSVNAATSGVTSLAAPNVGAPTIFRVTLDVSQDGQRTQAATGLLVMPKPNQGEHFAAPKADFTADELLAISPNQPHSAQILVVRPLRYPSVINVTLQDDRGTPLGAQNITAANGGARFVLPLVTRRRTMSVIASYEVNGAQHVAIKPIVVLPATTRP
ncbi:MAG: hypothetical protein JO092_04330, partial [Candidatus Eremiobacteraeota bacterium]|nr:hypothetical protein [Candidatus Eremiobacteraeota bacterium]